MYRDLLQSADYSHILDAARVSTSLFERIKMTVPTAGSPFTISWTGPTGFESSFCWPFNAISADNYQD